MGFVDRNIIKFNFEYKTDDESDWKVVSTLEDKTQDFSSFYIELKEAIFAKKVRINILSWAKNIKTDLYNVGAYYFEAAKEKPIIRDSSEASLLFHEKTKASSHRPMFPAENAVDYFFLESSWSPLKSVRTEENKNSNFIEFFLRTPATISRYDLTFSDKNVFEITIDALDKDMNVISTKYYRDSSGISKERLRTYAENVVSIKLTINDWAGDTIKLQDFDTYRYNPSEHEWFTYHIIWLVFLSIYVVSFLTYFIISDIRRIKKFIKRRKERRELKK